jgi:MFS family permease
MRLSSRTVIRLASLLYCTALPLPALAVNLPTLVLALFVLGLTNGLLDVAMNAQGVVVEQREGHPIFASFHAAFSGGGVLGSLFGGFLTSRGVAPLFHFCLVNLLLPLLVTLSLEQVSPVSSPLSCVPRVIWRTSRRQPQLRLSRPLATRDFLPVLP